MFLLDKRRCVTFRSLRCPVCVVRGGGVGHGLVAACVEVCGPVGQELQLRELEPNLVEDQRVLAWLRGALRQCNTCTHYRYPKILLSTNQCTIISITTRQQGRANSSVIDYFPSQLSTWMAA